MELVEEFFALGVYLKEDRTGWKKAEPVEMFYVKYDPKKNLPAHEANIPN